jgi:membrane-associated phospholipid phosphatase
MRLAAVNWKSAIVAFLLCMSSGRVHAQAGSDAHPLSLEIKSDALEKLPVESLPEENFPRKTLTAAPSPAPHGADKRHSIFYSPPREPGDDPENKIPGPLLKHLAGDQKEFWLKPFHLNRDDAKAIVPFMAFTGTLIAGDRWLSRQSPSSASTLAHSKTFSDYATYSLIGAAGASYFWGHFVHNDHLRETGFLAAEAALNSTAVTYLFKTVTERPRPFESNGTGRFFQGGASFPSEHSAIAWSVASVVAHEYPGTLTKIAAYGLASGVMLTRVTAQQHFASDVVVGSALGWFFARQVYRAHHDPELGGTGWGTVYRDSEGAPELSQSEKSEGAPNFRRMGSTYLPLDSWVYPAVERLRSLGYAGETFSAMKPWTRLECAQIVEQIVDETNDSTEESMDRGEANEIAALRARLRAEFAYEFGLLDGRHNRAASVESAYVRAVSISGPALTDSYHFGQTISYDFGRPFERGTNGQAGASFSAQAEFFFFIFFFSLTFSFMTA